MRRLAKQKMKLIIQELFGYLLAHYTIRSLIHQAARKNKVDPDRLSFINAVRILCRKITVAHFSLKPQKLSIFAKQSFRRLRQQLPVLFAGLHENG